MEGKLLSLKWRDHGSSFFRTLSSVRRKEVYCDVTLACDGRFYPVHKFVLSTCSDYFEQMFEVGEQKNLMIVITDIRCEELEMLIDYMYFGEVNVMQSDLNTLMKAAERLRIKGLAEPSESSSASDFNAKRSVPQPDNCQETKRKRGSDPEQYCSPEYSENIGLSDTKTNGDQGKHHETHKTRSKEDTVQRKEKLPPSDVHMSSPTSEVSLTSPPSEVPLATSLELTKQGPDASNNAKEKESFSGIDDREIKIENFSVKEEPEEWRHPDVIDDSSVFTPSEPSATYLTSTPALPVSSTGLGIMDQDEKQHQTDTLSGLLQPLPGPSGVHQMQNWDQGGMAVCSMNETYPQYRGAAMKGVSPRKTGRPTSDIWNHYKTEKTNGKNYVICIYCTTQRYGYPNATKMKIHTVKCARCPENIRKQYKKELAQMVARSEANKSIIQKFNTGIENQGFS